MHFEEAKKLCDKHKIEYPSLHAFYYRITVAAGMGTKMVAWSNMKDGTRMARWWPSIQSTVLSYQEQIFNFWFKLTNSF